MIAMAALARRIQTADGSERDLLLDVYHAANVHRFGAFTADWYRKEYEWLRANPSTGTLIPFPRVPSQKPT